MPNDQPPAYRFLTKESDAPDAKLVEIG